MSTQPLPSFESAAETLQWTWVSTSGNVCKTPRGGCAARNEAQALLAVWVARGLPRTGATSCGGRCHCVIFPNIDFGLGVTEDLDTGSSSFDTSDVKPPGRPPGTPFSEAPKGYSADDFRDELADLPVIGMMRDEVDSILRALEAGTIDLAEAKKLADRWLLGLL